MRLTPEKGAKILAGSEIHILTVFLLASQSKFCQKSGDVPCKKVQFKYYLRFSCPWASVMT